MIFYMAKSCNTLGFSTLRMPFTTIASTRKQAVHAVYVRFKTTCASRRTRFHIYIPYLHTRTLDNRVNKLSYCTAAHPADSTHKQVHPTSSIPLPDLDLSILENEKNLSMSAPGELADTVSRLHSTIYNNMYQKYLWMQQTQGYAYVQLQITGHSDKVLSPVTSHAQFHTLLDDIGRQVQAFDDDSLVQTFMSLLMLGTNCSDPVMTWLIMEIYDRLPQMNISSATPLNLYNNSLPRIDFNMTRLIIDRATKVVREWEVMDKELTAEEVSGLALLLSDLPHFIINTQLFTVSLKMILRSLDHNPAIMKETKVILDLTRLVNRLPNTITSALTWKLASLCDEAFMNQIDKFTPFDLYRRWNRVFRKDTPRGRDLFKLSRDRIQTSLLTTERLSDLCDLSIIYSQNRVVEVLMRESIVTEEINSLMEDKLYTAFCENDFVDPLTLSTFASNFLYTSRLVNVKEALRKHIVAQIDRVYKYMRCCRPVSIFLRNNPFRKEDKQKHHLFLFDQFNHALKYHDRILIDHIINLVFLEEDQISDEVREKFSGILQTLSNQDLSLIISRLLQRHEKHKRGLYQNCIYKTIYEQVADRVVETDRIDPLMVLASGYVYPLYRIDPALASVVLDRFAEFTDDLTDLQFLKTCSAFISNAYFHQKVYDDLTNHILKKNDQLSIQFVNETLILLSQVGYRPPNFDKLAGTFVKFILKKWDDLGILMRLQLAQKLCILQYFSEDLILKIFNLEFLDKVDKALADYGQKKFHDAIKRDCMLLNRIVVIECPELNIPWFHDDYCKTVLTGEEESRKNLKREEMVNLIEKGLKQALGGPQYIKRSCQSPYYHYMDFEFALDKMSRPIRMSQLKDLPEGSFQRCAVQVRTESEFCSNIPRLRPMGRVWQRHVELLGHRTIQIPHFEWNAMALAQWPVKLEYLRNKINGDSADIFRDFKFN